MVESGSTYYSIISKLKSEDLIRNELNNRLVELKNEKLFFNLIKAGFSQRRKTINNSLTCVRKDKRRNKGIFFANR